MESMHSEDDGVRVRVADFERWLRAGLREIEGRGDDELVEGHWALEDEHPLTVREVRERNRAALTELAVARHMRRRR